jgi:hypothetical protein
MIIILQDYESVEDMLLGMILGMVTSPLLMKLIRSLRQKRKVDRLLKEAAANVQQKNSDVSYTNSQTQHSLVN